MIDIVSGPDRDLKNIRQMGTPAEGDKVYIENAAYARIHEEDYEEKRVFIFKYSSKISIKNLSKYRSILFKNIGQKY